MPLVGRRYDGTTWIPFMGGGAFAPPPPPPSPTREDLVWGTYYPDATLAGLMPGTDPDSLPTLGDTTITTNGTLIQGRRISGRITVQAEDVHFKNCWFQGRDGLTGDALLVTKDARVKRLVIDDCLFKPTAPNLIIPGIYGRNFTVRRSHFLNLLDSIDVVGYDNTTNINVLIEQNLIEKHAFMSPWPSQGDDRTHNDGIQIHGGYGITIRGNTLNGDVSEEVGIGGAATGTTGLRGTVTNDNEYHPSVSGQTIGLTPTGGGGPIAGVTIEKNLLDYGAQSITIIKGSSSATNITIRNNEFGRNQPTINKPGSPVGGDNLKRPILIEDTSTQVNGFPNSTHVDQNGNLYSDTGDPITVYVYPLANI